MNLRDHRVIDISLNYVEARIIGVGEGEHFSLTPNILALRKRDNAQTGTVLAKLTPKLKNRHFWKKTFYRFTLHPTLW